MGWKIMPPRGKYNRIKESYNPLRYTVQTRTFSFLPFWRDVITTNDYYMAYSRFRELEAE